MVGSALIEGKGGIKIIDRWFTVPLDYSRPDDGDIEVFARSAINNKENDNGAAGAKQPICPSNISPLPPMR
jgi:hypothetical protein